MTTSVTIKNNGPYRVNVNEVEPVEGRRLEGAEQTVNSHCLAVGEEITLNLWGANHYLCVIETNDVDTPAEKLAAAGIP
jgi:hypothetical protein